MKFVSLAIAMGCPALVRLSRTAGAESTTRGGAAAAVRVRFRTILVARDRMGRQPCGNPVK